MADAVPLAKQQILGEQPERDQLQRDDDQQGQDDKQRELSRVHRDAMRKAHRCT
jgi:hypothetical protein